MPHQSAGLLSPDPATRLLTIEELTAAEHLTSEDIERLAECLGAEQKIVQKSAATAMVYLHRRGFDVSRVLTETLRCPDRRRRWGAAFALSLIGPLPSDAIDVLIECLALDDGDVRWAAMQLLVETPDPGSVQTKLLALLSSGVAHQRKMAAYCLRSLNVRSEDIDAVLANALRDPDPPVRLAALAALSRLAVDARAASRHIALCLDDADAGVRRAAAAALGDLSVVDPMVAAILERAALSDDLSLRRAAQRSLQRLNFESR